MIYSYDGIQLHGRCILRVWSPGMVNAFLKEKVRPCEVLRYFTPSHVIAVHNLIVDLGKGLVGDLLIGAAAVGLTYHALGTSVIPPAAGDTQLGSESIRKSLVSLIRTGNIISLDAFYLAAESNFYIQEAGIFGGIGASATPNSGTLFNHFLLPYDNSGGSPSDLTWEYALTIG